MECSNFMPANSNALSHCAILTSRYPITYLITFSRTIKNIIKKAELTMFAVFPKAPNSVNVSNK